MTMYWCDKCQKCHDNRDLTLSCQNTVTIFTQILPIVPETDLKIEQFEKELTILINRLSLENKCNIPDYLIAQHLIQSFKNLCATTNANNKWHGRNE